MPDVKVKIELISDGFLIFCPTGTFFREDLIDAVECAVEEFEDWCVEEFRIPFDENLLDTVDLQKHLEQKRKVWEDWQKQQEYKECATCRKKKPEIKNNGDICEECEAKASEQEDKFSI